MNIIRGAITFWIAGVAGALAFAAAVAGVGGCMLAAYGTVFF